MNFEFTEDQIALRDAAREAISRHRTEPVPGTAPHDGELWKALAELGALGLPFPEEDGGMGAGPVEAMVVALELGRAGVRTAYSETLTAAAMLGDDKLFGAAVEGSRVVVPALFEPMRAWSPISPARCRMPCAGPAASWQTPSARSAISPPSWTLILRVLMWFTPESARVTNR